MSWVSFLICLAASCQLPARKRLRQFQHLKRTEVKEPLHARENPAGAPAKAEAGVLLIAPENQVEIVRREVGRRGVDREMTDEIREAIREHEPVDRQESGGETARLALPLHEIIAGRLLQRPGR